jgi:hypothetical protein
MKCDHGVERFIPTEINVCRSETELNPEKEHAGPTQLLKDYRYQFMKYAIKSKCKS